MVQFTEKLTVRIIDDKCDAAGCTKGKSYLVVGSMVDSLTREHDGKKINHASIMLFIVNDQKKLSTVYPSICCDVGIL